MESPTESREDDRDLIYHCGETLKQFLPIYLSRIRKHYEPSAPRRGFPTLSPLDFHRKSEMASYRDRALGSAIRNISPSVVAVSYFYGVQRKVDCSGFIIRWDDFTQVATLLTSAKLMRSPLERDDYYIIVRLANGKLLEAVEDYVDYYHNIATLPPDTYELMPESSVDSTVVVKEVYEGSPADKIEVCPGDSITAVNGIRLSGGLRVYTEELDAASNVLSTLSACGHTNFMQVCVKVNDGRKLVVADNLNVNDNKFCSSWLMGDDSDWTMEPLIGSQTRAAVDIASL